jgi:phosphoglycerate kinase
MVKSEYYVENMNLAGKNVVCRCDFNVPMKNGVIMDDFRIRSAIPTIQTILSKKPKYVMIVSHFGRPAKGADNAKYSLQFLVPVLSSYLNAPVQFLAHGISEKTLYELQAQPPSVQAQPPSVQHTTSDEPMIYLLENVRFHEEETAFDKTDDANPVIALYKEMGDVFICDAFGCVHRSHMSITCGKRFQKAYGYGHLIKKEMDALSMLTNTSSGKKMLCIIGGNKIEDKLPIIDSLKIVPHSTMYIAGGLAKKYKGTDQNVKTMRDGYGNTEVNQTSYPIPNIFNSEYHAYDIGKDSLQEIMDLVKQHDIVFWNGTLGIIEHDIYKAGTVAFMNHLCSQTDTMVIIGGGETASMVPKVAPSHFYVSTGGGALLEYIENKILHNTLIVGLAIYE